MDPLCYFQLVFVMLSCCLFIDALWSPAGKGLTSLLSFVMSNCEVVTFPLVFWVRCLFQPVLARAWNQTFWCYSTRNTPIK